MNSIDQSFNSAFNSSYQAGLSNMSQAVRTGFAGAQSQSELDMRMQFEREKFQASNMIALANLDLNRREFDFKQKQSIGELALQDQRVRLAEQSLGIKNMEIAKSQKRDSALQGMQSLASGINNINEIDSKLQEFVAKNNLGDVVNPTDIKTLSEVRKGALIQDEAVAVGVAQQNALISAKAAVAQAGGNPNDPAFWSVGVDGKMYPSIESMNLYVTQKKTDSELASLLRNAKLGSAIKTEGGEFKATPKGLEIQFRNPKRTTKNSLEAQSVKSSIEAEVKAGNLTSQQAIDLSTLYDNDPIKFREAYDAVLKAGSERSSALKDLQDQLKVEQGRFWKNEDKIKELKEQISNIDKVVSKEETIQVKEKTPEAKKEVPITEEDKRYDIRLRVEAKMKNLESKENKTEKDIQDLKKLKEVWLQLANKA